MAEEKHRMLYQGQDPCQMATTNHGQEPATIDPIVEETVTEPPPYDDAIMMMPSYTNYNFTELNSERCSSIFPDQNLLGMCMSRLDEEEQQQQEEESMQVDSVAQSSDPEIPEQLQQEQQLDHHRISLPYLLLSRLALPQVRNFFAVSPQPKLGNKSIPIVCPACGQNGLTLIQHSPNTRTHTFAMWLCSFGWCCCACLCPYFMDCCRTTSHYCSNCQIYLGAYYPNSCFHQ